MDTSNLSIEQETDMSISRISTGKPEEGRDILNPNGGSPHLDDSGVLMKSPGINDDNDKSSSSESTTDTVRQKQDGISPQHSITIENGEEIATSKQDIAPEPREEPAMTQDQPK